MDDVKVLVTGAGAPGIKGTLYSLRNNQDGRKIVTVGVDMRAEVTGKYLCDSFYQIPPSRSESFLPTLFDICEKEHVEVIVPQVTGELLALARHKREFEKLGTMVALSDEQAIELANDKDSLLKLLKQMGEPTPEFRRVSRLDELDRAAEALGYPFIVKPPVSNGMRGFRIIYDHLDRKRKFFEEKPDSTVMTRDELASLLGESFPDLVAMEHLPGPEYSVDILSDENRVLATIPRKRTLIRSGITFEGQVEKREDIIRLSERLTLRAGLKFAHGLQFKEDRAGRPMLLESNPRVQGTMVLSTIAGANVIYGAVRLALGESVPEFKVDWNTRLIRYWGGLGLGKTVVEL